MSAKLTLDKFELIWYLQCAMSGSHLRWGIYEDFVNIIYPQLNDGERKFIHDIAIRDCSWHFEGEFVDKTPHAYFKQVLACFNPDNRYIVEYDYEGENGSKDTYLWDNEYYIDWTRRVNKDYITKITKKAMSDNYEHIHHATDSMIAEMLEELTNLWSYHPKEELEILVEAAKRLRTPPLLTFHEEYMGEC